MSEVPDERDALVYLDVEDALEVFAAIIGGTPEHAVDQLRSREALEGALGRPVNYARYEDADLAAQAAVLAHVYPELNRSSLWGSETSSTRARSGSRSGASRLRLAPPILDEIVAVVSQRAEQL